MEKIEILGGVAIQEAVRETLKRANEENCSFRFDFNGTEVIVNPNDDDAKLIHKWHEDFEAAGKAHRESPEYKESERKRAEELKAKMSAAMIETAQTEDELRTTDNKWPYTMEQLTQYVESLVKRQHDYGTCVYAMSLAAVAAFNYVAHELGVTGFQASCADLDFLRRTRHLKGPFMIINAEDALYPQYDILAKIRKALVDWKPWLAEQATQKLNDTEHAHPDVIAHWQELAKK